MRFLSWLTVGLTYFLMVWGNVVSSTGSGLACPDWPLCQGTMSPPMSGPIILEWGHRLLAFASALMIFLTVYFSFSLSREPQSPMRKLGRLLIILLVIQIFLGGLTVFLGLSPMLSTLHLIIATLVWSGLIAIAATSQTSSLEKSQANALSSPKVQRLSKAGLYALLVQLTLGALVKHFHAGLSCPQFPNCLGSFFPVPFVFQTAVTFAHRWWGFILLGLFVHLAVATKKQSPHLYRTALVTLGLSILQILLGIGTVMSRLHTHTRITHAAVGYALWGCLFYLAVQARAFRGLKSQPTQASTA